MTYLPLAILLTVALLFLTFLGERKTAQNQSSLKCLAIWNAALTTVGFLLSVVIHIKAASTLANASLDANFASWASDMFDIWYQIALPTATVLLVITTIASILPLADKKQRTGVASKIRVMTACASSVLLLLLAPFYGFMTENDTVPLYQYILWSGVGMALTMRLSCTLEYLVRIRIGVNSKDGAQQQ